jgi:hypothetical protein
LRRLVRIAFALGAFFAPPRALSFAASLLKNSATTAGVIFASVEG